MDSIISIWPRWAFSACLQQRFTQPIFQGRNWFMRVQSGDWSANMLLPNFSILNCLKKWQVDQVVGALRVLASLSDNFRMVETMLPTSNMISTLLSQFWHSGLLLEFAILTMRSSSAHHLIPSRTTLSPSPKADEFHGARSLPSRSVTNETFDGAYVR